MPSNPFSHGHFYVNPTYREHIRSTVDGLDMSAADARSTRAGLEAITGPCYFAVTTDAIALYRYYYASLLRGGGKDGEASL